MQAHSTYLVGGPHFIWLPTKYIPPCGPLLHHEPRHLVGRQSSPPVFRLFFYSFVRPNSWRAPTILSRLFPRTPYSVFKVPLHRPCPTLLRPVLSSLFTFHFIHLTHHPDSTKIRPPFSHQHQATPARDLRGAHNYFVGAQSTTRSILAARLDLTFTSHSLITATRGNIPVDFGFEFRTGFETLGSFSPTLTRPCWRQGLLQRS